MKLKRMSMLLSLYLENYKRVASYHFYEHGKIVLDINNSYLTHAGNYVVEMEIPEVEVKRANKINLNRKDVFYVNAGGDDVHLYIPTSLMEVIQMDDARRIDSNGDVFYNRFKIVGKFVVKQCDRDDDGEWITKDVPHSFIIEEQYSHTEYTEEYLKARDLKQVINEICRSDLSVYDVQQVLKYYEITKKEGVEYDAN